MNEAKRRKTYTLVWGNTRSKPTTFEWGNSRPMDSALSVTIFREPGTKSVRWEE